ncbi:LOW QUALITY PROTEIN: hypothetical protein PHMEG_00017412 [Phytophthora megakarya]|uniref:Uncharacterized protein n=1 Tax=Phytophthora megakarya TaxID=4795 RepID=A0A225VWM5_9STRA|nr:LOW QUALITY PROTEIN: hypothetical protein PHMEG_00017412 [Phytophthora megakarya]
MKKTKKTTYNIFLNDTDPRARVTEVFQADRSISKFHHGASSPRNSEFKSSKPMLIELYERLEGIQQYQIFSADDAKPGVVICKKSPDSESVEVNRSRCVPPPNRTTEKIDQMYHTIRPYVPA